MAHNIHTDKLTGEAAFFTTGKAAWHGLGTIVQNALTWKDAMNTAHLDWSVEKHRIAHPFFNNGGVDVPELLSGVWGTFRSDTKAFLGIVGDRYEIVDNRYAFDFVDALIDSQNGGAHYVTAGALGNGERIWCLARIQQDIRIPGTDDLNEVYLLFTTSHDGSGSAQCKITTTRVVCNNTLNIALRGKGSEIRVKHTASAKEKLETAKRIMSGVEAQVKDIEAKFTELAHRKMQKEAIREFFLRAFPPDEKLGKFSTRTENKIDDILKLFEHNDGNAIPEIRGTAYNLLNAVTNYYDHHSSVRKTAGKTAMEEENLRAESALFGAAADTKTSLLDTLLDVTKDAPRHEIAYRPWSARGIGATPENDNKATVTVYAPEPPKPVEPPKPKQLSLLDMIIDGSN